MIKIPKGAVAVSAEQKKNAYPKNLVLKVEIGCKMDQISKLHPFFIYLLSFCAKYNVPFL